jgi:hypothetical protein
MGLIWTPSCWPQKPPLGTPLDREHPLAQGRVLDLLLNENGGNRVSDLSYNAAPGTVTGPAWVGGIRGPALNFAAANNYITWGAAPAHLKLIASDLTIVAWIKPSEMALNIVAGTDRNTADGGWSLLTNTTGRLAFSIGATVALSKNSVYAVDVWQQVAVTYAWAARAVTYYVNGVAVDTDTQTVDIGYTATRPFVIGVDPNDLAGNDFQGLLDSVAVYNRVLIAGEMARLYLQPFCMYRRPRLELWAALLSEEEGATYTSSGGGTAGKATAAAAGTFTAPVYAGTGSPTVGKATAAAVGTFTAPVYAGTGSPIVGKANAAAAGMFTVPTYIGSGNPAVGTATGAAAGTFTAPVYAGTGSPTVGKASAAATGTFTVPVYTGSGGAIVAQHTGSGYGLFRWTPIWMGEGNCICPRATASGTGTFMAGGAILAVAAWFLSLKRRR